MDTFHYILDHMYFPAIEENTLFLFDVDFDENNQPKAGNGSKKDL